MRQRRWLRLLAFSLGATGVFFVVFLILTWFAPWTMIDAGVCTESPIGYYRFRVVAYEMTDYGGGEVRDWWVIGNTRDFIMHMVFGADICPEF